MTLWWVFLEIWFFKFLTQIFFPRGNSSNFFLLFILTPLWYERVNHHQTNHSTRNTVWLMFPEILCFKVGTKFSIPKAFRKNLGKFLILEFHKFNAIRERWTQVEYWLTANDEIALSSQDSFLFEFYFAQRLFITLIWKKIKKIFPHFLSKPSVNPIHKIVSFLSSKSHLAKKNHKKFLSEILLESPQGQRK